METKKKSKTKEKQISPLLFCNFVQHYLCQQSQNTDRREGRGRESKGLEVFFAFLLLLFVKETIYSVTLFGICPSKL